MVQTLSKLVLLTVLFVIVLLSISPFDTSIVTQASGGAILQEQSDTNGSDLLVNSFCTDNLCLLELNLSKFTNYGNVLIYHRYTGRWSGYFTVIESFISEYEKVYQEVDGNCISFNDYSIFRSNVGGNLTSIVSEILEINEYNIDNLEVFSNGNDGIIVVYLVDENNLLDVHLLNANITNEINKYLTIRIDKIILVKILQPYDVSKNDAYNLYKQLDIKEFNNITIGYDNELHLPIIIIQDDNSDFMSLADQINKIAEGYVVLIIDHNPPMITPLPEYRTPTEFFATIILGAIFTIAFYELVMRK